MRQIINYKGFRVLAGVIIAVSLLNSCDLQDLPQMSLSYGEERILLNNNVAQLNDRVTNHEDYYLEYKDIDTGKKSLKATSGEDDYVLVLRSEVEALTYQGETLQATDVRIEGDYAYVSYATRGEKYLGGVEVINISDSHHPVIESQIIFTDTDVYALATSQDYVYLAAAKELSSNSNLASPAVLERISLDNNLLTSESHIKDIPGYVGKSVSIFENQLYSTSADLGGLSSFNLDNFSLNSFKSYDEARDVKVYDNEVYLLKGEPAQLIKLEQNQLSQISIEDLDGGVTPDSKATMEIQNGLLYVSLGENGMKIIDIHTGELVEHAPRPTVPENKNASNYVTNAVSVDGNYVFIANGTAGLYFGHFNPDVGLSMIGSMDFNSSTNFVEAKDQIIFVATGTGGVKILEMVEYNPTDSDMRLLCNFDEFGVPESSELGEPVDELLNRIHQALPEFEQAPLEHPEYFNAAPTSITLTEDAELWVTFLSEGAGWTNSLGYYIFDQNDAPHSPLEINRPTIIFPNVSAPHSGGNLKSGTRVSLGNFKAGQTVGFFLIGRGWKDGLVEGVYTHYSNPEITQPLQNILLYDPITNSAVLSFEDIKLPGGDKDFNDAIFKVHTYPEDAMQTDAMNVLN